MKILVGLWIVVFVISMHTAPRSNAQMTNNPFDTIRLIRTAIMGIAAMFAIGPLFSTKKIGLALKPPMLFVMSYSLLALFSMFYAPNALLTAWKSMELLVDAALATVIVYYLLESGPSEFINAVNVTLGLLIIIMEIEGIFNPVRAYRWYEGGPMRRQLGGIYPSMNPSMFAYVCSFTCVMSLSSLLNRTRTKDRILYTVLLLTAITGVILSHSRSGMISSSIGIMVALFTNRRIVVLAVFITIIAATVIIPQGQTYWLRTQSTEEFSTMTGRTTHWQTGWNVAKLSPIYGHGFYSIQRTLWQADTLDNYYLDVFIGLGIIGIAVVAAMLIALWRDAIKLILFAFRTGNPKLKELTTKIITVMTILTIVSFTGKGFAIHGEAFMMLMSIVICIQSLKYGDWLYSVVEDNEDNIDSNQTEAITSC